MFNTTCKIDANGYMLQDFISKDLLNICEDFKADKSYKNINMQIKNICLRQQPFDFLGGAMVFFGKKSLFSVFGEKNNLFLILRKKNCLFHPQLPLYVMLKLKEKNCFRLVAKKIDCFSPQSEKKICPEKKPIAPPQKIKWLLP